MATTPLRQRIFAGVGAAVFLVTSLALTIGVIVDMTRGNTASTTTAANDTTSTCAIDGNIATDIKLGPPDTFIPDGDITDVKTTDLKVGDGATAKIGSCVQVKYYGTLASDGTKFDDNYGVNNLFQFELGGGQVIPGWDVGVSGMKEGGVRRLVIPSNLAYGEAGAGIIPANADLVFVVRLINIVQ